MSNQVNTTGRGETRTQPCFSFLPSLVFFFFILHPFFFLPPPPPSTAYSSFTYCFFNSGNQRCKLVCYFNYPPFFYTHITLFPPRTFTNYTEFMCVRERRRESGLCPLGLSVSLIKDRRLTERECVALLACRPQQQHYPGGL